MNFWQSPAFGKFMRLLHSYSSMLVLVLLLFFAVTGITLNHPDLLQSQAGKKSRQLTIELPEHFHHSDLPEQANQQQKIAEDLYQWLRQQHQVKASVFSYRIEAEEGLIELDFKRPAGYVSAIVDFNESTIELEEEFNGYLALLNDLHKGRHAGGSWILLIDLTAIACIIFAITGFYLMLRQNSRRSAGNSFALLGILLTIFAYIFSLH